MSLLGNAFSKRSFLFPWKWQELCHNKSWIKVLSRDKKITDFSFVNQSECYLSSLVGHINCNYETE